MGQISSQRRGATALREILATGTTKPELPSSHHGEDSSPESGNLGAAVLLIDDDALVRDSAVALLSSIGVSVQTAKDGPTGLEMLEHGDFQLVLCDRGLPGMDGTAVVAEIKSRWPNVPVVLVSGATSPEATNEVSADAFLEKPFTFDDLMAVLKAHAIV